MMTDREITLKVRELVDANVLCTGVELEDRILFNAADRVIVPPCADSVFARDIKRARLYLQAARREYIADQVRNLSVSLSQGLYKDARALREQAQEIR